MRRSNDDFVVNILVRSFGKEKKTLLKDPMLTFFKRASLTECFIHNKGFVEKRKKRWKLTRSKTLVVYSFMYENGSKGKQNLITFIVLQAYTFIHFLLAGCFAFTNIINIIIQAKHYTLNLDDTFSPLFKEKKRTQAPSA